MSDRTNKQRPDWLDEFEDLANTELGHGSACTQVHPIIANWYEEIMAGDPPLSRDSVWQAMNCLTTELLTDMPAPLLEVLDKDELAEDLADWVVEILLVGRALQAALESGRLDDL